MTLIDPGSHKAQQSPCDSLGTPARHRRASLVLAIIAITAGAGCIVSGQVPPGIIFTLAGVAGIITWHRS